MPVGNASVDEDLFKSTAGGDNEQDSGDRGQ